MNYEKVALFGKQKSRGTFDDFFNAEKYGSLEEAYQANDYVQAEFVKDENGTLYIEARNVNNPDVKKYHRLNYQIPFAGLDVSDDYAGCELAASLL